MAKEHRNVYLAPAFHNDVGFNQDPLGITIDDDLAICTETFGSTAGQVREKESTRCDWSACLIYPKHSYRSGCLR